MPTTTDMRKYSETVLEQGKAALEEARKPWLAAVGATSLAYGQLREQLAELPADTQARLRRLQEETQVQLRKLQELATEHATSIDPAQVSAKVRKAVEDYTAQAIQTYESQARRGEKVVRTLRGDPRVMQAFTGTQQPVERAEELVTDRPVTSARATTRTAARKAPARTAPAGKTAAKG